MVKEALKALFQRDLNKLKQEITLYKKDENLWKVENSIKNSGGNLCLHIIGNLKTYVGNGLSNIGYVRQRDLEFSSKNVERDKMLAEIEETMEIVDSAIEELTDEDLEGKFPVEFWSKESDMVHVLIHLHAHLNYHLGQINYHRRILEK